MLFTKKKVYRSLFDGSVPDGEDTREEIYMFTLRHNTCVVDFIVDFWEPKL